MRPLVGMARSVAWDSSRLDTGVESTSFSRPVTVNWKAFVFPLEVVPL